MSTPMVTIRDKGGVPVYAVEFADISLKWQFNLASATPVSLTLPTTATKFIVNFAYEPGAEVWVAKNTTATLPASGTPTATSSELLPISRVVNGGTVLSFISSNAAHVGVIAYAI